MVNMRRLLNTLTNNFLYLQLYYSISSILASSNLPSERVEEAAVEVFDGGDEGGEGRRHRQGTCGSMRRSPVLVGGGHDTACHLYHFLLCLNCGINKNNFPTSSSDNLHQPHHLIIFSYPTCINGHLPPNFSIFFLIHSHPIASE